MSLPYHLQRLPPEALSVLRYLESNGSASADDLESKAGLSSRLVGKAIRRLVNFDYIEMVGSTYQLTTDGKLASRDLAQYDAQMGNTSSKPKQAAMKKIQRHLSVVMPRVFNIGNAADLYIGVNPPGAEDERLPGNVKLELRVSAVGGTLSPANLSIDVPPNKAATPGKVQLTPAEDTQIIRVHVDAFQTVDEDSIEPLGGMYFDVRVSPSNMKQDSTLRAVGIDVWLQI